MSNHDHAGEESTDFRPKFSTDGLLTAVVSETGTGLPLMVAHMNADALEMTLKTGQAHFWSRSRQELWHKGATSGNVLVIDTIRTDCDQDAVWMTVTVQGDGTACHTGRKSCFYRDMLRDETGTISLSPPIDSQL
ncbi:MAG: phosphoribosyl-AMP cyclohydrolase [Ahrensia sp.]|nr:phosphoribosyl-AMP cyclohydrolase [Ahrensia sp.]